MYIIFSPIRKLGLHMVASSALKCLAKVTLTISAHNGSSVGLFFLVPNSPHIPQNRHAQAHRHTHTTKSYSHAVNGSGTQSA